MSVFRIVLVLDDTIPAQATLLSQIQTALSSIANNLVPVNSQSLDSIEVQKLK
jgi:hypothetical protein